MRYTADGQPLDPIQEAPNNDATLPAAPGGQSADASQPGAIRKMWDAWTSHPENNAAMINFGLQLMQPLGPGQSQFGHFAQAVGAGGEALNRNVAAQQERDIQEQKSDLAEREADRKEAETAAYVDYTKALSGGKTSKPETMALQQRYKQAIAQDKAWQNWLAGEKLYLDDPLMARVTAKYPGITDRKKLALNPEALEYARREHANMFRQYSDDAVPAAGGEGGGRPVPTPSDRAYARAHPEVRDRFVAKFGVEP